MLTLILRETLSLKIQLACCENPKPYGEAYVASGQQPSLNSQVTASINHQTCVSIWRPSPITPPDDCSPRRTTQLSLVKPENGERE